MIGRASLQWTALIVGVVFALGLGISGMTLPSKVIGFLDVTGGKWDPALAFVMASAVTIYAIGYRLIVKRDAPRFAPVFRLPTASTIDKRLVIGSLCFGAGWGLAGYCPGPALTSLPTGAADVLIFVGAMYTGMFLYESADNMLTKKTD